MEGYFDRFARFAEIVRNRGRVEVKIEKLTTEQLHVLQGKRYLPLVGLHTTINAICWRESLNKKLKERQEKELKMWIESQSHKINDGDIY